MTTSLPGTSNGGPFFGTIPADAPPSYGQLFDQLLEFQWRGIGFPVAEFAVDLRQDQTIHKIVDKDGAHVEGTGRHPLQFTARVPFLNGLSSGLAETWGLSNNWTLYPTVWRQFFQACADKSTGDLQHPELGVITCKCESARTRWAADVRTGVWVDVTWIESDDSAIQLTEALQKESPIATVSSVGAALDAYLSDPTNLKAPELPTFPTTFGDFVNAIRGTIDQTTILQRSFAGRIDNLIYQATSIEDALDRSVNANALNWPVTQACEQMKSAAYVLKATIGTKSKTVALYTVPKDSTLGQIAATLGADLGPLMALNVAFVGAGVVPGGSVVRYYA